MKNIAITFLALTLILGFSISTAFADIYISGNFGAVSLNNADVVDATGITIAESTFDTGYGFSGAVGNNVTIFDVDGRAEIEVAYRINDVKDAITTEASGDVTTLSLMLNFFHDYNQFDSFIPFVGAGVGATRMKGQITIPLLGTGDVDETVIAVQGMIGGGYAVTKHLNLDLQYRFFGTENEYYTHNAMAGIRYSF